MRVAITELEEMVEQGCSTPGCDHKDHEVVFFQQRCHPGMGLDVRYTKGSGELVVSCRACRGEVATVAVALI